MFNRCSSGGAPVAARKALLMTPLLGAAKSSQAIAPRKGGVTNDAVTNIRTVRRNGMSVRATSQPIGAATRQQMMLEEVAMMMVVMSGSRKIGLVTSSVKFASVKAPLRSTKA